jgi:mannose-1-phosphate guanylyltransferase
MKKDICVVIMAGGTGTRFWPYSRNDKPKQFLDVTNTGRTLLQMTFDRFSSFVDADNIYIVSNDRYAEVISEQLPQMKLDNILLEPLKRNTAPCIAYAAYKIREKNPNAIMVVAPSDHIIFQEDKFRNVVETACADAEANDHLITIGIKPHKPETGYGYIQYLDEGDKVKKVKTFTEKPSLEIAQTFLDSGDFVWNAGIFVWSIDSIVKAFEAYQEDLAETFAEGKDIFYTDQEKAFIKKAYSHSKGISIDYAVMEKAKNVFVVLGDFGWSDLGSWDALHELRDKDENDNVIEGNTILYDSKSNFVKGAKDKLIVLSDLEGYLVADFKDVLLVCKKDDAAKFKTFVNEVKAIKGDKYV